MWLGFDNTMYHLKNAEITPELHDDLINFSFEKLEDVFKNYHTPIPDCLDYTLLTFIPCLLADLKQPSSAKSDHICQTFQVHFNKMLCNVLEKYHDLPGFALLLGTLLQYLNKDKSYFWIPLGISAFLYLVRQQQGPILDDIGFFGIWQRTSHSLYIQRGMDEFCAYFAELLENPDRLGTHIFDQQRYVTATKECVELCSCSPRKFSKVAIEVTCDKGLRRNKPWVWMVQLGLHSRIQKARQHLV